MTHAFPWLRRVTHEGAKSCLVVMVTSHSLAANPVRSDFELKQVLLLLIYDLG